MRLIDAFDAFIAVGRGNAVFSLALASRKSPSEMDELVRSFVGRFADKDFTSALSDLQTELSITIQWPPVDYNAWRTTYESIDYSIRKGPKELENLWRITGAFGFTLFASIPDEGIELLTDALVDLGINRKESSKITATLKSENSEARIAAMEKVRDFIRNASMRRSAKENNQTSNHSNSKIDVFISYATPDSSIANELREDLENVGLRCFMADKNINVAMDWSETIRLALVGSKCVLVLLTSRSLKRSWVMLETGASWVLRKPMFAAINQVETNKIPDLLNKYQARVCETKTQRKLLAEELRSFLNVYES